MARRFGAGRGHIDETGTSARGVVQLNQVIVIGAGAAGLAAAGALKQRGVSSLLIEAGDRPGESWHRRYNGLQLNSVRWMSSLPGYRMERRYGDFPSREAWAAYLARYVDRFDLAVRYGTEVERIRRDEGTWKITTSADDLSARAVVVATGLDHTPLIPDWPGRENFIGELMHSADFRDPAPFRGQDVVVVGAGNSATEIAVHLARGGARRTSLAVRTPPLLLPPRLFGISITAWAIPAGPLPDKLLDAGSKLASHLSVGDLTSYGLPPSPRGISAQRRDGYVAPIDRGFSAAVKSGDIEVVGAVEGFDRENVVLANGERRRADSVVAATGYRTGLADLVGEFNVLGGDERPVVSGGAWVPSSPGLHFIGFHYTLIPTLPHLGAEARGIAQALEKQLGNPRRQW